MSQEQLTEETAKFEISNIGGIEHTTATLKPGVTILAGKNATNRTSFLQAIMGACGSKNVTLKADAEEGYVELMLNGETYSQNLTSQGRTVTFGGTPYLDDSSTADLFAFLLENNEARQAVAQNKDLREIIMRPVDTEEIEREIRELESERNNLDEELQQLDSLEERVPELEEEKQQLQNEIKQLKSELENKNQKIEELDASVEETREEKEKHDAKIEELTKKRQKLQNIERRIESEQESIENLEDERGELKEKLDDMNEIPGDRISQIDQEIQHLRGQIQQIDSIVGDLQSVIKFNEEFLEESRPESLDVFGDGTRSESSTITDQLVEDTEEVVCWTCGSEVGTDQIESTLNQLQEVRNDRMTHRQTLKDQIGDLQDEKSTLEDQRQERKRTKQKLEKVEAETDSRETALENLKEQKEKVSEALEMLNTEVNELEETEQSEILEVQKQASQLEVELNQLEANLDEVNNEIEEVESKLARREDLEQQREEISSELADLRTRVEDHQEQAIEEFNHHMDAVLDRLGYENIERVWIERIKDEVRKGRRKVTEDRFELHIVRSTESGTVYEDTVNHLSESEREVIGLVFALAGYLLHDVYEHVPFMLLDSIETIDSGRITRLVDYLAGYAKYLVVALLEEDAAAFNEDYPHIRSI